MKILLTWALPSRAILVCNVILILFLEYISVSMVSFVFLFDVLYLVGDIFIFQFLLIIKN